MSTEQLSQRRRQGRPVRVFGTLVCLLGGFVLITAAAQAAFPGRNGRLGLGLTYQGSNTAYTVVTSMEPDGSRLRFLGEVQDGEIDAAFSPSGKKVVLARNPVYDARRGIYLMRSDARGDRRLLARGGAGWDDSNPDWSPSGRAVVYQRSRVGRGPLVKVYKSGRSRTVAGGRAPVWSSRGTIAFNRGRGIFTMRGDGSGLRRVTLGQCIDWSPHAQWILFATPTRELAMVRPNGADMRVLLPAPTDVPSPALQWEPRGGAAFSPDGIGVAVIGYRSGEPGLYVTRLDGGGSRQIQLSDIREGAEGEVLDWSRLRGR